MARSANKDTVRADLAPPDAKKGLGILRNRIKAKKDHVASTNGEISGLWDEFEKLKLNKKGGRIFLSLDGLEDVERNDILRTIDVLSKEAGWGNSGDMLDQADNNVVQMPKPRGKAAQAAAAATDGAGEAIDSEGALDPADYKAAMVARLKSETTLEESQAYVLANKIWDELDERDPGAERTLLNAHANVEGEIASWPDESPEVEPDQ